MDPQETNVQQQRHLWSSSPLSGIPAPLLDPPEPVGLRMTLPQDPMAGSCLWSPVERVRRHLQVDHRLQTDRGQFLRLMRKHLSHIWGHGAAWTTWSSALSADSGDERGLPKRTQAPKYFRPVKFLCFLDATRSSRGRQSAAASRLLLGSIVAIRRF